MSSDTPLTLNPSAEEVWLALRTFNCKELEIRKFLEQNGLHSFIPMVYTNVGRGGTTVARHLVPAVHNQLFLQHTLTDRALGNLIHECPLPVQVLTKIGSREYYRIPAAQMTEFRLMCDPQFVDTQYLSREEADLKPGREVRVVHGPFAGVTGKLIRVKNKFFIIKVMAEMGLQVRISRWYCEPV